MTQPIEEWKPDVSSYACIYVHPIATKDSFTSTVTTDDSGTSTMPLMISSLQLLNSLSQVANNILLKDVNSYCTK